MRKRILSLLIAAVMLFGLMPFAAFANSSLITEVVINLSVFPKENGTVSAVEPSISTVNGSVLPVLEENVSIYSWEWYRSEGILSPDYDLYSGDLFEPGYIYDLYLRFNLDGYTFDNNCVYIFTGPNGETVEGVPFSATDVDAYFDMSFYEVDHIMLQLSDLPQEGKTVHDLTPTIYSINDGKISNNAITEIYAGWYWYDPSADEYYLEENETFRADTRYNLWVEITLNEDFEYVDPLVVDMICPDGTMNGSFYNQTGEDTVSYDFYFDSEEKIGIQSLSLSLPADPEPGMDPFLAQVTHVNGYEGRDGVEVYCSWAKYDEQEGGYFPITAEALGEERYSLTFDILAKDGYFFEDNFTISVVSPSGPQYPAFRGGDESEQEFALFYDLRNLTEIESISLRLPADPAVGESPSAFVVEAVNGSSALTEAVMIDTWWGIHNAQEEIFEPNGSAPFSAGEKYVASFYLHAEDGYVFGFDCEVTIQSPSGNKSYLPEYSDENELDGTIVFGTLPSVSKTMIESISLRLPADPVEYGAPSCFEVEAINGSSALTEAVMVDTWWGIYNTQEEVFEPCGRDLFRAGERYAAAFFLTAEPGYAFANDCEVTIQTPSGKKNYNLEYNDGEEMSGQFRFDPLPATTNPFKDAKKNDFFYDAVRWAVANGITNGVAATRFGPFENCNRSQVVTFLWRAAGKPEPMSDENPFVDVSEDAFYYDAVLWAVENGITNGMNATHFEPETVCSRAQIVTFLWRAAGEPEPSGDENPFKDVSRGMYYYDAVLWAVEEGITNGTDAKHFSPDDTCIRGQVVTFLYRKEF